MARIAMGVEYDGSQMHGWQYQSHDPKTVQQHVETALSRVADHPVRTVCAGRTDSGVHACQQVIHFDSDSSRDMRAWQMGGNRWLPPSVALVWAKKVPEDFHARFSARSRRYRYLIYNSPVRPALFNKQLTWYHGTLDVEKMSQAAQALLGKHDFTAYRAKACQAKNPTRTISHINLFRKSDLICLDVQADGFLQHMVRNIVGVLLAIGDGRRPVEWAAEVLAERNRDLGGVTAPPYGLFFVGPQYDACYAIPVIDLPIPHMPI